MRRAARKKGLFGCQSCSEGYRKKKDDSIDHIIEAIFAYDKTGHIFQLLLFFLFLIHRHNNSLYGRRPVNVGQYFYLVHVKNVLFYFVYTVHNPQKGFYTIQFVLWYYRQTRQLVGGFTHIQNVSSYRSLASYP